MKKRELFYDILIAVVLAAIIGAVVYKFVLKHNPQMEFATDELNKITLNTLSHTKLKMSDIIKEKDVFVLIIDMNDCYTCIHKGIEDLKRLQKSGKECFVIVIHDYLDEVKGWSETIDFKPFYAIEKVDYYEHIHSKITPVLIHFKKGRINKYNFILK